MVKLAEKLIQIQEFDGSRVPFDAVELQTRLIHCFLAAGLRDSSYMAEDIALAVEYTLLNSNRPEPVFGRGELGSAVVRMLEETGFPEVAALFRRNGSERLVTVSTRPESVSGLLAKFLACPPERFERIVRQVCEAARLLRFEPIQYIQGKARFLERDFHVEPGVLIPRPETEELVERILTEVPAHASMADIGTGSGCIAVTLALEVPDAQVQAWDISETAIRVAKENAKTWQASVDFIQRDVLTWEPKERATLDVIVSNPPYVTEAERAGMEPNVLLHEPEGALFVPDEDPLRFYRHIGELGRQLLVPGGKLYFETNRAYGQETETLLRRQGYTNVRTDKDLSGNDRFVIATQPC